MQKQHLARAFYRQGVDAMDRAWHLPRELVVRCRRLDPDNRMYRHLAGKCSEKCNSRL